MILHILLDLQLIHSLTITKWYHWNWIGSECVHGRRKVVCLGKKFDIVQKYAPSIGKPLLCYRILHAFAREVSVYENRRTVIKTINYSGSRLMISKRAEMNLSYDHYDTTNQRSCWQARFKLKQDSIQATQVLAWYLPF